jgi:hypothetical protein
MDPGTIIVLIAAAVIVLIAVAVIVLIAAAVIVLIAAAVIVLIAAAVEPHASTIEGCGRDIYAPSRRARAP